MSVSSQQESKGGSTTTSTKTNGISTVLKASSTIASLETGSNGCVICEGTVKCPVCAADEYCVMTSLTCNSCPYTYCAPKSNSTANNVLYNSTSGNGTTGLNFGTVSKNSTSRNATIHKIQGAVAGGVIGFVCFLLVIWYSFYWRKKKRLAKARTFSDKTYNANDIDVMELDDIDDIDSTEENIFGSDEDIDEFEEDRTSNVNNSNNNTWNSNEDRNHNNVRMTPLQQLQYINEIRSMKVPNIRNGNNNNNTFSLVGDRTSTASTVRSSASNILPIGYIPGVTSTNLINNRMTKNINGKSNLNTYNNHLNIVGDIRSHITLGSSILEEVAEDLEDDNNTYSGTIKSMRPYLDKPDTMKRANMSSLTTAIKGKPKLVQINEAKDTEENDKIATETESIKSGNQNYNKSNNNIAYNRGSVGSDVTETGSYILDFKITPLDTRLQPPIPAASQNNITNSLPSINNMKRSSQVSNPSETEQE